MFFTRGQKKTKCSAHNTRQRGRGGAPSCPTRHRRSVLREDNDLILAPSSRTPDPNEGDLNDRNEVPRAVRFAVLSPPCFRELISACAVRIQELF